MKVYKLHEITSSNVMYNRNPPKFIYYIILIILGLIVAFFIWSSSSIKTFIVRGQGLISYENKTNIMIKTSTEIKEINIQEGQVVKAGDVLVIFNAPDPSLQMQQINEQLEYLSNRIELINRAEIEVSKGINTFKSDSEVEKDFFNRLKSLEIKSREFVVNEEALKKSNPDATPQEIANYKKQQADKAEALKYDVILNFTSEKNNLQIEKTRLESQNGALNASLNEYKLFAPSDGIVHLNISLNKGMILQGGTLIGTISDTNSEVVIDAMIKGEDRPRIHENDDVSLAIGGLNQAEYGTLSGKVISIDKDATIDNEKGNVYFKAKIKPDKNYLEDKKGDKVMLTQGMVTETRIKYEKITYMKYFLEQIGVKFK